MFNAELLSGVILEDISSQHSVMTLVLRSLLEITMDFSLFLSNFILQSTNINSFLSGQKEGDSMGISRFDWNQFSELRTASDLSDYLRGREYNHTEYYHYTRAANVEKILNGHKFLLSNVHNFNDKRDVAQFCDPSCYFSMCFSTGTSENLPMWYLYSGMQGKGARIRLTKSVVRRLIKDSTYALYKMEGGAPGKCVVKLKDGENMELEFGDIIYSNNQDVENVCRLKYNTMTNNEMPLKEFENYRQYHMGFCKGLIWFYEKETRLLIRLTGDAERCVKDGGNYAIMLQFDENLEKRFSVTFAPNITTDNFDQTLNQYPAIKQFYERTAGVFLSSYQGTVQMDFCSKCERVLK